ncbi:MAG: HEPN domain-containing protein [Acetobacterium sp.]|nr:HEPN domain-containing protein [Acetobacterium sp.]
MKNQSESKKWLARAKSNLSIAQIGKISEDLMYEDLGNNCHAAVEKALKALLVYHHIEPNYKPPHGRNGHSLEVLIKKIEELNVIVPDDIKNASSTPFFYGGWSFPWSFPWKIGSTASLMDYAVDRRYPGKYEPLTENGYKDILVRAGKIVEWVEEQIKI